MTETRLQEELRSILQEPHDSVRSRVAGTFDEILQAVKNELVLYGAGNLGRKILAELRANGIQPLAFTDRNPNLWQTEVDGLVVLSPDEAAERFGPHSGFFVAVWSLGHDFNETAALLHSLRCSYVYPSDFIRWKFPARFLPDFCRDLPSKVYEAAADVEAAGAIWADEGSRETFLAHVKWRCAADYSGINRISDEESYFIDSLFDIKDKDCFIDCGAYDGDTIRALLSRVPAISEIVAFEPDPANFQRLAQWHQRQERSTAERIDLRRTAVGSSPGSIRFTADGTEGAHVAAAGDILVDCIPLDIALSQSKPSYIKMDIEGFEYEALVGATNVIQKHRPILAVCVYHKQNDLWRIPLLIHSICPEYKLYLREHESDGWQLVCYAVPDAPPTSRH